MNFKVKVKLNELLICAAIEGDTEYLKKALDAVADVNEKDKCGNTALMYAASSGRTECVKALLDAGADVHEKNGNGKTALILAAEDGHTECVKLIEDHINKESKLDKAIKILQEYKNES